MTHVLCNMPGRLHRSVREGNLMVARAGTLLGFGILPLFSTILHIHAIQKGSVWKGSVGMFRIQRLKC